MPNTTTQAIVLDDFTSGLWFNEGDPPNNKFATFIENLDVVSAGGVQKRPPLRNNYNYTTAGPTLVRPPNGRPAMLVNPKKASEYVVLDGPAAMTTGNYVLRKFDVSSSTPVWSTTLAVAAGPTPTGFTVVWGSSQANTGWYVCFNRGVAGTWFVDDATGTATAKVGTFVDNLAAPGNATFTPCKLACTHLAYMFLGSTETSLTHQGRVRWSHPGRFEDYRTNDFLDIGEAWENLIGMHSHAEHLVFVKERSIWLLTGFDSTTFEKHQIVEFPTISQSTNADYICSASSPTRGVFVSMPGLGVFRWFNNKLVEISTPIADGIKDGRVLIAAMAVVGNKLYCTSTRGLTAAYADKSWVYDIDRELWTQHNAAFHALASHSSGDQLGYSIHSLGSAAGYAFANYGQQVAAGSWVDNHLSGTNAIVCTYRSPWQTARNPARKKRWRRCWVVFNKRPNASASDPVNYNVTVYKNWDGVHPAKTGVVSAAKSADTTDYNANYGYGHATTGSDYDEGEKLSSIGSAYSCQLKIDSSGTPSDQWGFDSLTFKYVNRSLK